MYVTSNSSKTSFNIIVDADSCPVKDIIYSVAREKRIPVILIASISHVISVSEGDITLVTVDNIPQAADIAIINRTRDCDIVITGDYGLAAAVLSKKATPLSPRGRVFSSENIDSLLMQRHIDAKIRRSGGRTKGPRAFTSADRQLFESALRKLIMNRLDV